MENIENKKNNNTLLIILIAVFGVAVLSLGGYIIYDKVYNKANSTIDANQNKKTGTELDLNNSTVKGLEPSIFYGIFSDDVMGQMSNDSFFANKKVTIDDLNNKSKILAAYLYIKQTADPSKENISDDRQYITEPEMNDAFHKVFGKNAVITHESFSPGYGYTCEYDHDGKGYDCKPNDGGGTDAWGTLHQIYKAVKYSDKIELYEYYLACRGDLGECYYDHAGSYKLSQPYDTGNADNIDKYDNDFVIQYGRKYKHTFKLESGNYYWYSTEPVK